MRNDIEFVNYKDLSEEEKQARDLKEIALNETFPWLGNVFETIDLNVWESNLRCVGHVKKDVKITLEDAILVILRKQHNKAVVSKQSIVNLNNEGNVKRLMLRITLSES